MSKILGRLSYYPVKGCAGIDAPALYVGPRGIEDNLEFMVKGGDDRFRHQLNLPRMALIQPELSHKYLTLNAPGMESISIPLENRWNGIQVEVFLRKERLPAVTQGSRVSVWLTEFLQTNYQCDLVGLSPKHQRRTSDNKAATAFVDSSPILVCRTASLKALSDECGFEVPQDRFRANLWIEGGEPWEEGSWKRITVGNMTFEVRKPCVRCGVINIDQALGEVDMAHPGEPYKTLKRIHHNEEGKPVFGMYMYLKEPSLDSLRLGDPVQILEAA